MQYPQFSFISDSRYRSLLEQDYMEISKCIKVGAHKAAATLAGSIVEALLTDYLLDKGVNKVQKGKSSNEVKVEKAGLANLIEYCDVKRLISSKSYFLLQAIRDFRNLIHPAKAVRSTTLVSEPDARLYKDTLDILIKEIGTLRQKEFGATAEQLMAFVMTDHNAVELFPHMVQSANNEEERSKFLACETPATLEKQHNELSNFFDAEGEPNIESSEEIQYMSSIEETIRRIYLCFHACYQHSSTESQKNAAHKLLLVLKFGKAVERDFWINLFEPSMLVLVDGQDAAFMATYIVINMKSMMSERLEQVLPQLGRLIDESYVLRIIDAVLYHIRNKRAIHITVATSTFLSSIRNRHYNMYLKSLERIRETVVDGGNEDSQRANDSIIGIFLSLNEKPPMYDPF